MTEPRWHVPLAEILAELAGKPADQRFVVPLRHGTMSVEVYAPLDEDKQSPHRQDELYIVISGTAEFVKEDARVAVGPQDLLFVRRVKCTALKGLAPISPPGLCSGGLTAASSLPLPRETG